LPHCEKQDHNIPSLGTNQPRLSVLVSFSPKGEKVFFFKKITEQKKIYTFTRGDPLTFFLFLFLTYYHHLAQAIWSRIILNRGREGKKQTRFGKNGEGFCHPSLFTKELTPPKREWEANSSFRKS